MPYTELVMFYCYRQLYFLFFDRKAVLCIQTESKSTLIFRKDLLEVTEHLTKKTTFANLGGMG